MPRTIRVLDSFVRGVLESAELLADRVGKAVLEDSPVEIAPVALARGGFVHNVRPPFCCPFGIGRIGECWRQALRGEHGSVHDQIPDLALVRRLLLLVKLPENLLYFLTACFRRREFFPIRRVRRFHVAILVRVYGF